MGSRERRPDLRVLIIAEHASARFGGEAILPLHYFRKLRARGIEAWMIVHERTRAELEPMMPDDADRLHFVSDTRLHRTMDRLGRFMPHQISYFTVGYASRLSSQLSARLMARRLIPEKRVTVVHQPIPVSPREPSVMYDLGAPVVMGPLNGGMTYPSGFEARSRQMRLVGAATAAGRRMSSALHRLMPGKLRAATLLVANERTRRALPRGYRGKAVTLVENGVDLARWPPPRVARAHDRGGPVHFAFLGRLVDWKAVDLLLLAFAKLCRDVPARLTVIGDGPMRAVLEGQAQRLSLAGSIRFAGWLSQGECSLQLREADALVLPSLYEAGGAVVLEAMASGLPVVATNWGGPADYVDESCGILIDPSDPESFVEKLAAAMLALARSPELRERMGQAALAKVSRGVLNWDDKIERVLEIYAEAIERAGTRERLHDSLIRAAAPHSLDEQRLKRHPSRGGEPSDEDAT